MASSAKTAGLSTILAFDSIPWDFDHIDAEKGSAVVAWHSADAAGQLLSLAHAGRAGVVDDDTVLVFEHHRMGVRSAAGLHLADLLGAREVRNVEDAQTAETVLAHIFIDTLTPAVDAAACLFDRHNQEISHDGDIALSAWTDDQAEKDWRFRIGEAVILKPW